MGVIALLIALIVPPLQLARSQAMQAQCSAQLQHLGYALTQARHEYEYYPFWDDGGSRLRYTWIDVLIQQRYFENPRGAYCPEDARPDPINEAHGREAALTYPGEGGRAGIDYSYGIGVPLSAGGWAWRPGPGPENGPGRRRFEGEDRDTAGRVLAGDANWSWIYNLNGAGRNTHTWNYPTWYGNTVAWRHRDSANLLKQDGHVTNVRYHETAARPVDTIKHFVWYPGEPLNVGPDHRRGANYYPNVPPPSFQSDPQGQAFPNEMLPRYYTSMRLWTLIPNK